MPRKACLWIETCKQFLNHLRHAAEHPYHHLLPQQLRVISSGVGAMLSFPFSFSFPLYWGIGTGRCVGVLRLCLRCVYPFRWQGVFASVCVYGCRGVWIGPRNLPRAFALGTGFDLAFFFAFLVKLAEMPELLVWIWIQREKWNTARIIGSASLCTDFMFDFLTSQGITPCYFNLHLGECLSQETWIRQ